MNVCCKVMCKVSDPGLVVGCCCWLLVDCVGEGVKEGKEGIKGRRVQKGRFGLFWQLV